MKLPLFITLVYRWDDWNFKKFNNLSNVTHWKEAETQVSWLQRPYCTTCPQALVQGVHGDWCLILHGSIWYSAWPQSNCLKMLAALLLLLTGVNFHISQIAFQRIGILFFAHTLGSTVQLSKVIIVMAIRVALWYWYWA